MKTLLRLLPDLALLAALCGAGWAAWSFQSRCRTLDAEKGELEVVSARLRAENDRLVAETRRAGEARDALARELVSARAASRKAEEETARLLVEKDRAEASLREEMRLQRERFRAAVDQARSAEGDAVRRKLRADGMIPALDTSLRELVELTDRAPRRAD